MHILRVEKGQVFGYDYIRTQKQQPNSKNIAKVSCACEGDLISDEFNTKVLFVNAKIIEQFLTKHEFESL